MAIKTWEIIKISYCQYAGNEVRLEAELVYPAEWLPDQNPRVAAHRCSNGIECNMRGQVNCLWAGTNPVVDPFI